ncbi:MAG: hypothetical protein J6Y06_06930, partial [Bacteroidales bacterium]|nr:hypothetical protein [Bacteroidales bacterium]
MFKTCFKLLLLAVFAVGAVSCGHRTYKSIAYFQDVEEETSLPMEVNRGIVIQPQDKISIVVSTTNSELAKPYNLPRVTYTLGAEGDNVGNSGNGN